MNYQTEYIVIKLPLKKEKGFYHTPEFDKYSYMQKYKITLNGDPILTQIDKDELILVFKGYPFEDNSSPLLMVNTGR